MDKPPSSRSSIHPSVATGPRDRRRRHRRVVVELARSLARKSTRPRSTDVYTYRVRTRESDAPIIIDPTRPIIVHTPRARRGVHPSIRPSEPIESRES